MCPASEVLVLDSKVGICVIVGSKGGGKQGSLKKMYFVNLVSAYKWSLFMLKSPDSCLTNFLSLSCFNIVTTVLGITDSAYVAPGPYLQVCRVGRHPYRIGVPPTTDLHWLGTWSHGQVRRMLSMPPACCHQPKQQIRHWDQQWQRAERGLFTSSCGGESGRKDGTIPSPPAPVYSRYRAVWLCSACFYPNSYTQIWVCFSLCFL